MHGHLLASMKAPGCVARPDGGATDGCCAAPEPVLLRIPAGLAHGPSGESLLLFGGFVQQLAELFLCVQGEFFAVEEERGGAGDA